jgi:uncharacterized membrane protein YbhN (UPF0104 family)
MAVGCVLLAILLLILVWLRHKRLPRVAFLEKQLKALTEGLNLITSSREMALLVVATIIVWTADTLAYWLLARALNANLALLPMLLVMGMSCLKRFPADLNRDSQG